MVVDDNIRLYETTKVAQTVKRCGSKTKKTFTS